MIKKPLTDQRFKDFIQKLPPINMHTGPWITGGSARRLWQDQDWTQGDVDVFFANEEQRISWLAELDKIWNFVPKKRTIEVKPLGWELTIESNTQSCDLGPGFHCTLTMQTTNATSFDMTVPGTPKGSNLYQLQVIHVRLAPSLHELWQTFDFNLCCFAVDATHIYADPLALQDLAQNTISLRSAPSKNLSLRVLKHHTQGIGVSDELLKMGMQQICDGSADLCNNY